MTTSERPPATDEPKHAETRTRSAYSSMTPAVGAADWQDPGERTQRYRIEDIRAAAVALGVPELQMHLPAPASPSAAPPEPAPESPPSSPGDTEQSETSQAPTPEAAPAEAASGDAHFAPRPKAPPSTAPRSAAPPPVLLPSRRRVAVLKTVFGVIFCAVLGLLAYEVWLHAQDPHWLARMRDLWS